ncbi:MAG: YeeE/YedE family protein [Cytophagales bacterium]|nr:YeeE/YedE family protein [Cytophagales bacterium]
MEEKKYMNPYLAGLVLGFVLLGTIYITGRGLGASGAVKSTVMQTVKSAAPGHYENTAYYAAYAERNPSPMKTWLTFEVFGLLLGAMFSGLVSGRFRWKLEKGPRTGNRMRLAMAVLGGALFGIGSQFGRGCTSGAALSGMAVQSAGGILTMLCIFGMGYAAAYFFRKLWI